MENNINYIEENENIRLKLELCNRQLLLKQKELELYRLKSDFRKRKSKVCRKRKSKFPIKFKPKILKPNKIIPIEFKNPPEIEQLYDILPEKDLPSDFKSELLAIEKINIKKIDVLMN